MVGIAGRAPSSHASRFIRSEASQELTCLALFTPPFCLVDGRICANDPIFGDAFELTNNILRYGEVFSNPALSIKLGPPPTHKLGPPPTTS